MNEFFELIDHIPIYSNNITSNIITNNEYIIYIQIPTRNSETISNNHEINNEFNNEKISSKISNFSSATGQDTNVAKINSFGGKTGDAKSGKL